MKHKDMKYLLKFKTFETLTNFTNEPYFIIPVINFDDSINKIEDKFNLKVRNKNNFDVDGIVNRYHQKYFCLSINWSGFLSYMPLIDTDSNSNYGEDYFNSFGYEFGGYINCTKEEVELYKEMYNNIEKFNV